MNILVTGANGQLGEEIKRVVNTIGNGEPDHYIGEPNYYIFTGRDELDITNEKDVDEFVRKNFINVIVNCAAYTNVDKAQTDRDAAYNANALGALNLALAAKAVGAVMIQVSTDYVFGGKYNAPLPPMSQMDAGFVPVDRDKCFYGFSKLVGEDLIEHTGCKYLIFRTSWVYSSHHKNFLTTMNLKHNLRNRIKVVDDQIGCPTSARELAKFIVHIIEENNSENRYLSRQGIYNFAGGGFTSWYGFAQEIFGEDQWMVSPCTSEEFPTPVERPKYSVLDTSLTEETFGYKIPNWKDSVHEVLEEVEEINRKRREALEEENTEWSYGHNVCIKEKEEV